MGATDVAAVPYVIQSLILSSNQRPDIYVRRGKVQERNNRDLSLFPLFDFLHVDTI